MTKTIYREWIDKSILDGWMTLYSPEEVIDILSKQSFEQYYLDNKNKKSSLLFEINDNLYSVDVVNEEDYYILILDIITDVYDKQMISDNIDTLDYVSQLEDFIRKTI